MLKALLSEASDSTQPCSTSPLGLCSFNDQKERKSSSLGRWRPCPLHSLHARDSLLLINPHHIFFMMNQAFRAYLAPSDYSRKGAGPEAAWQSLWPTLNEGV